MGNFTSFVCGRATSIPVDVGSSEGDRNQFLRGVIQWTVWKYVQPYCPKKNRKQRRKMARKWSEKTTRRSAVARAGMDSCDMHGLFWWRCLLNWYSWSWRPWHEQNSNMTKRYSFWMCLIICQFGEVNILKQQSVVLFLPWRVGTLINS